MNHGKRFRRKWNLTPSGEKYRLKARPAKMQRRNDYVRLHEKNTEVLSMNNETPEMQEIEDELKAEQEDEDDDYPLQPGMANMEPIVDPEEMGPDWPTGADLALWAVILVIFLAVLWEMTK